MKKAIKQKWLKALRSGEFKQAQGQLRDKGAYCCLGVLCKVQSIPITRNGLGIPERVKSRGKYPSGPFNYGVIWDLITEDKARALASLNDDGKSFPEIADYIEKNL
jgi:hypothetical protein